MSKKKKRKTDKQTHRQTKRKEERKGTYVLYIHKCNQHTLEKLAARNRLGREGIQLFRAWAGDVGQWQTGCPNSSQFAQGVSRLTL